MLRILKRFFDFCGAENKKKFYKALFLGVVFALLEAVKIPAILLLIDGAIKQNVTESLIVLCLGMLVASLAAASVVKYQITMLQCEAGYYTACGKRIEIAEHMRYLLSEVVRCNCSPLKSRVLLYHGLPDSLPYRSSEAVCQLQTCHSSHRVSLPHHMYGHKVHPPCRAL